MSKFTPELLKEFCSYVSKGLTDKDAAYATNISPKTICTYLAQGREYAENDTLDIDTLSPLEKLKLEFYELYKNAQREFKNTLIQQIIDAGKVAKHWAANAWLLERKFPQEFAKNGLEEPQEIDRNIEIKVVGKSKEDTERVNKLDNDIFREDK